ncbi:hypothetical protein [Nodosilinea nodulosa]|uniref:hypothetical protein n=1 Tax=Nodosilinea nodulosa TaxID=416001 RepID=UPI0002D5C173|nr:hypothetical protein [Nodosilinea nodulosa]
MPQDSNSSPALWATLQAIALAVLQVLDLRLALLMGLAAFMLAVGFDSAGNPAKAADLVTQAALVPTRVSAPTAVSGGSAVDSAMEPLAAIDDARQAASLRLRHGTLTSAIITSNRLTDAHFFTDLPAEP